MTPIRLSETWYRRFYGVLFTLFLLIIALFAFDYLSLITDILVPKVTTIGAAAAGFVALLALGLFFTVKKTASTPVPGVIAYVVSLIAIAYISFQSGGVDSPFAIIWALLVCISPLFGAVGWLTVIVITGGSLTNLYLDSGLTEYEILLTIVTSIVPLIIGFIAWHAIEVSEGANDNKDIKHLASQLSEVATKSEIVINAIGDGVIAVDGKGVIQLINPAAQEILGWGKQDALLLNYKSILQLTDENNHELNPSQDPIQQVLNTNQKTRGNKLNAITQSGKKLSVSIVVSPIGDPGSGVIAVFRDVTNERAEEREQAEFISTASHEMRTPVASIEGYLGLALNPSTAQIDEKARDFIMKAHEAAQHLGRLFQDLLDVAKSEDGRMTQVPKVVDMVQYTQTIAQGLTQKATDKGLRLIFKPTDASAQRKIMPVYFVNQDNDHIREIIDNLIENAIKYTPQGEVTVDVTGSEDKVVVSVTDTGLGIPTEDIPHLFQKFYRVDNMDRQSIGGTGLGLYLSRRLAESMQGRLWVESTFGKGSTFFLELPRIDGQEAARLKQTQDAQTAQAAPTSAAPAPLINPSPMPAPAPIQPTPTATPQPAPAPQPQLQPQPQTYAQPVTPVPSPQTGTAMQPVLMNTVQAAPVQQQQQPQAYAQPAARPAPATTVPRGESLTKEQIAERVRQLELLAQQQRNQPPTRQ